ncbi:MAG: 30S ribosome-binding factor RbfA [Sphingobacteriales bacterium]|nr:30S ribosome-binding factor RbfA [Sphingobacteriales bacterium]
MESKRQQKFARVIQKDLGEIFQREGNTLLPNSMITVTKVRATPDLGIARVFLSFFNSPNQQLALNTIKAHSSEIRYNLGKRIKDQVKGIPQLEFFIDDTSEYVDRMDKIFTRIHKDDEQNS